MMPIFISALMTSVAFTDILWARSATVMVSGTCTSRTIGSVGATKEVVSWVTTAVATTAATAAAPSTGSARRIAPSLDSAAALGISRRFLANDLLGILADTLFFGFGRLVQRSRLGRSLAFDLGLLGRGQTLFLFPTRC